MRRRNRVEEFVTNGCNPEEKGCETTVINTCSRSRKSLPQLVEGVSRPGVSRSVNKYKAHHKEFVRGILHKMNNGEMKQSKKLLEDIAEISGNCLTVCPSQEGGILRQFPQESPLANGQILIDGQVLIRLMAGSMTNRRNSLIIWWSKDICVDSLPNHVVLGGLSYLSVQRYKVMLKNSLFKNIKVKSKTVPEIWSMSDFKAKEEITLQKDVQVSVQALEQLGSQLRTLDEGDENSEWQWDCHIPFIRRFKKIMKGLQALLKVELREVRTDKRRQGDAEDELVCSKHQEGSAQRKGYGLGPNRWSFVRLNADTKKERSRQRSLSEVKAKSLGGRSLKHLGSASMASLREIEESNDLVNHIGGVFRYFILDVVDHGSTPDVTRCGRELGEKFLSREQGLNRMSSERDRVENIFLNSPSVTALAVALPAETAASGVF
ncbi:hypothetical protein F2Q69_00053124 [Brassica cretica]|uniref:Uncharacterized protein n=1 Tax=Brassica cretica TaxID=69181 RepID=A0A8S9N3K3_BRACR|nr:hypothetical protein F2Q69_00053124 [Brassica cretica]